MPRTSKAEAAVAFDEPVIQSRAAELDGYTVVFESYSADVDPAPFFQGLPEDRCQCPHWGVVVSGRIVFRYADHDEVYEAGDAYYGRPGHIPLIFGGSEVIEFSPTEQLQQTMDVVSRNLAAAAAPSGAQGGRVCMLTAPSWTASWSSWKPAPLRTVCSRRMRSATSRCRGGGCKHEASRRS